jgi:hypothetical protein
MRDIVATIQPDQDDIVRASADQSLCVQGAPGTGKTAVGLHRVAYLLYAYPGRMLRGGVLVIGPNRAFLSYIRGVLPALGEADVVQQTIPDLLATVPVRAADSGPVARVKGDARMAEVLRRALWAGLSEPAEALVLTRGSWRWRVHGHEIAELMEELRERGVRYGAGRTMLSHRIAHVILTRMEAAGEATDDRTHEAVRRTRQVRAAVDAAWPAADPVRLVMRLLSDPALLARAADGVLEPPEQAAIRWDKAPRGPGSARWTAADAVLIDEASDLIERIPSLAHVVVDEAQDLSPMECRAVGRRCSTGSATVLGDLAQATAPAAEGSWPQLLAHLGKPEAGMQVLDTGYRVPRQILDFASMLLPDLAPGLAPARSLRQDPGSLTVTPVMPRALPGHLVTVCGQALARPGSAAVIASDEQVPALHRALAAAGIGHQVLDGGDADGRLILLPVTLAKGLEFDDVIVVEPARIAAQPRGLHRLYVALTRAVSRLTVLHTEPLPGPLRWVPGCISCVAPGLRAYGSNRGREVGDAAGNRAGRSTAGHRPRFGTFRATPCTRPSPLRSIACACTSSLRTTSMASVTRLERDSTLPLGTATVQRLERLAGTLEERGLCVTLVAPPSRVPRLQVAHPAPEGATGDIYASRGRDGSWWFWWPWAERIGAEGNLEAAAATIEQALTRSA